MADGMLKTMPSPGENHLKEEMHCLICDADVAAHDGYSILYTVLPSGGSLLSDNIFRVLRRDLEVVTTRSSVICSRCFSLFDELAVVKSRYDGIRKEIDSFYRKTCEIYNDEISINIRGVACQTDGTDFVLANQVEKTRPDIKLKIAIPKRKRGRPFKTGIQKRRNSVIHAQELTDCFTEEIETVDKSKWKERQPAVVIDAANNDMSNEVVPQTRRTRFGVKNYFLGNGKKKNITIVGVEKEKQSIKKENEHEMIEQSTKDLDFRNLSDNSLKAEDTSQEGREMFTTELLNKDDDDFEWKEEPTVDTNEESTESEYDIKDVKSVNEDDWQSSSSKDGKKRQKKKKKRKRGDRRGERAFMVPIHECNQCGKKWRTVTELKSHIASHSAVRPFVCEICGQAYKMKKALDIHIGMHNGIHPFVCSYCNKSFTQKVGLEKHLPIHTGVTRFQCDLCGKRFIHQKSFNIHKMTHTGEKNIRCPACNLAVFSQSHLKRHYRVHTGERPYGCNICGKKFAEKYNLNAHARIHDPNTAGEGRRRCHTCPICGVTYDRKHKMADHLSSVHYIWQSSPNLDFKSEDFCNMDVGQHHLQQLQVQQSPAVQVSLPQQPTSQQQPHVHQQQQLPQISSQQPQQQPSVTQAVQQVHHSAQMTVAQPQQQQHHHHMTHHQHQPSSHHIQQQQQQHHPQGAAPPHHILISQRQMPQPLQTHLSHHPVSASIVANATPPPLQPINSVFQLVSVQPTTADQSTSHHNRMNTVSTSLPVPTL